MRKRGVHEHGSATRLFPPAPHGATPPVTPPGRPGGLGDGLAAGSTEESADGCAEGRAGDPGPVLRSRQGTGSHRSREHGRGGSVRRRPPSLPEPRCPGLRCHRPPAHRVRLTAPAPRLHALPGQAAQRRSRGPPRHRRVSDSVAAASPPHTERLRPGSDFEHPGRAPVAVHRPGRDFEHPGRDPVAVHRPGRESRHPGRDLAAVLRPAFPPLRAGPPGRCGRGGPGYERPSVPPAPAPPSRRPRGPHVRDDRTPSPRPR